MNSPAPNNNDDSENNSLPAQLQQIGLRACPPQLDDFHCARHQGSLVAAPDPRATGTSGNRRAFAPQSGAASTALAASRDSNPWPTSIGPGRPRSNAM